MTPSLPKQPAPEFRKEPKAEAGTDSPEESAHAIQTRSQRH